MFYSQLHTKAPSKYSPKWISLWLFFNFRLKLCCQLQKRHCLKTVNFHRIKEHTAWSSLSLNVDKFSVVWKKRSINQNHFLIACSFVNYPLYVGRVWAIEPIVRKLIFRIDLGRLLMIKKNIILMGHYSFGATFHGLCTDQWPYLMAHLKLSKEPKISIEIISIAFMIYWRFAIIQISSWYKVALGIKTIFAE